MYDNATALYLICTPNHITSDAKSDTELKKRIAMSKDTYNKMTPVFKNRNISTCTKLRTLRAYVWSILLYGCESWTLNKGTERRLEAAEMWFLRRILKISWKERKTNKEILTMADCKRTLIKTIRERQMKFFGHINRKNGLEKLMLCGKIDGKKNRGRQRITFTNSLNKHTTNNTMSNTELIRMTNNRKDWNAMIVDVCTRPDT